MIIAGRRKETLDDTVAANPGMHSIVLDIDSPESIRACATSLKSDWLGLNVVLHTAVILHDPVNFLIITAAGGPL
ncbi:hypothetical protein BIY26_16185 [Brenneria goodwinii]|uniref:Uncharacterized protein n=1 Tax=Brenneria goodwinii TaxID=1109412 RepID=A0A0G4K2Q8_9GAMM|nr:hypothetical protein AWC36_10755 [Brenneria goodwinii]RLM18154.1 hypothetical protein BIY28_19050 [Brenneria goodwinii]RLM20218.1 hypothetical protein BIY26_16185 [Brenneria goodwinii]CPR21440.1 hypothetical protein BN1221_04887c [Brenneria goodwinii]